MKYISVSNPSWNHDGSMIDCVVVFDGIGEVPFTASPNDYTDHGKEIYERCVSGEFGPVADYVPKPDEGPQPASEVPAEMRLPVANTGEVL